MKIGLIALPLLFAINVVLADEGAKAPAPASAPNQGQIHAAPVPPKAHHRAHGHPKRHFAKRDRRACLDLKDNKAIIRCAEQNGKKHKR